MSKIILKPKNLEFQPRPTYPYSPGTKAGNMIYTAAHVPWYNHGKCMGIMTSELKQYKHCQM